MESKKVIIFMHIPKSGGSSFWHSLVESAAKSANIAIADCFHEALIRNEPKQNAYFHAVRICGELKAVEQNLLLMHMHYPKGNYRVIEGNINYILLHRDPLERMRSAFRHWRQKTTSEGYALPAMDFFTSDFVPGINQYLSCCLSESDRWFHRPSTEILDFVRESVTFISFNEYVNNGPRLQRLSRRLGIDEIPIIHHPETITVKSYNEELDSLLMNDDDFRINWGFRIYWEYQWHKDIGLIADIPV